MRIKDKKTKVIVIQLCDLRTEAETILYHLVALFIPLLPLLA